MLLPWQTVSSTTLVDDRWMKLTADRCRLPDGKLIEPYYVMHESDWVHVVAQAEDSRLLVVRQFRYGAKTMCVELPGGVIDAGEDPLVAARRELLEETGYSAAQWHSVGTMYANPARQTNTVHIFLARGLTPSGVQTLDESESIEFELMSVEQIQALIDCNEFSQALHIASFYRSLRVLGSAAPDER